MVVVQAGSPDNADPMKRNTTTKTMRRSLPVFAQIVQLIPPGLIENLADACRIKARVFAYAHYAHQVLALLLGQLSGAFSLNEICDAMAVHARSFSGCAGFCPPAGTPSRTPTAHAIHPWRRSCSGKCTGV